MEFLKNYKLHVSGYVKVGPAKFDIAMDIDDALYLNPGHQNMINRIKERIEEETGVKGKFEADVKYHLDVSGYVDCMDVIKHAEIKFTLANDDVNA